MIIEVADCCLFAFFRAAPSSVAAIRLNHSASPVQEVSPMGFVFGANSGYYARLLCLLYHIAAIW